jgi:ubiquinone biosynthesis protein UbiJ
MSLGGELAMGINAGLETALNTALRLDPQTLQHLSRFSGKVIAIELQRPELTLYLLPGSDGISLMSQYPDEPDTVLSGSPLAMAKMALGPDASKVLFAGEVTIRGDVETGQRFKRLLDQLEIDWEELLSRYSGDFLAHKFGDLVRASAAWGQQALNILGQDAAEYLQLEGQDLPQPAAVQQFLQEVDNLRDDTARLEARVARLQKYLHKGDDK